MFCFHTADFFYIASMGNAYIDERLDIRKGKNVVECRLDTMPLTPGVYCLCLSILDKFPRELFYGEMLKTFTVKTDTIAMSRMPTLGIVFVPTRWSFV